MRVWLWESLYRRRLARRIYQKWYNLLIIRLNQPYVDTIISAHCKTLVKILACASKELYSNSVELPIQLTPLWCIALSYKRIMTTTLQLLLPVFLVTR